MAIDEKSSYIDTTEPRMTHDCAKNLYFAAAWKTNAVNRYESQIDTSIGLTDLARKRYFSVYEKSGPLYHIIV